MPECKKQKHLYCFIPFQVLKDEFPKGVDIIYESVGGDMFDLCLNALAPYGRLIVIGMISQVRTFSLKHDISGCFMAFG